MDVLLVNARLNKMSRHACSTLPLGLAYIGAVLREAGYSVSAIDLNVTPLEDAQITQIIGKTLPRIVAISTQTPTHLNGLSFTRLAKAVNPDIKVIIGGAHASVLYEDTAKEEGIDIVVRGEGEYAMLELADCLIRKRGSLADIKGIAYKDNDVIRVTDRRPHIKVPDVIPFPARDIFPYGLYSIPNSVLASRGGCPFACHFCAVNSIWEGKRIYRSPDKVLEEIKCTIDVIGIEQARYISFSDDTLSLDRECVIRMCRLMRERMNSFQIQWRCATRVDLVDTELLKEMYDAGCVNIQYGIEAGSQKILDSIGKKISLDQIKRVVDMTLNSGIDVDCSFIFPAPEDTEQTIREQIQFMKDLQEMEVCVTTALLTPFPGTYLYENANRLGIKILSNNWDDYDCRHIIIAIKNFSKKNLEILFQELMQETGLVYSE